MAMLNPGDYGYKIHTEDAIFFNEIKEGAK